MSKKALVTGAGSGIGREAAILLSEKGYSIIAVGRTEESLRETQRLCSPGSTSTILLDVGVQEDVRNVLSGITGIDALILSAGICERSALSDPNADSVWERTMSANLDGVWYPIRATNRNIRDGGRIVVLSSGLGKNGREGHGAYVASKHAVLGLVKCFAPELAPRGITVNAVCPGWVDTEMSRKNIVDTANSSGTTPQKLREEAESCIPMRRFVTGRECAELIAFLCSESAQMITGQSYNINGGEFTL